MRCLLALPLSGSVSAGSHGNRGPRGLQESRAKGVRAVQYETYLRCNFNVFLDQASCKGHTTLRDGPVEEILGQGR